MFAKIALGIATLGLGLAPVSSLRSPVQREAVTTSFEVHGQVFGDASVDSSVFEFISSQISGDSSTPWYSVSRFDLNSPNSFLTVPNSDSIPSYSRICLDNLLSFSVYVFTKWAGAGGGVYALPVVTFSNSYSLGAVSFNASSCSVTETGNNGLNSLLLDSVTNAFTFNSSLTSQTLSESFSSSTLYLLNGLNYFFAAMSTPRYVLESISDSSVSSVVSNFNSHVLHTLLYDLKFSLSCTYVATPVEVVDIYTLIAMILTMPFTFFSQAFDVDLFWGTAYAFNVSTIVYSVFVIVILWAIVRLLLGFGKS